MRKQSKWLSVVSLLLVTLMLIPVFASCNGSKTPEQGTTPTTEASTARPYLDDLGEFDFDDYTFNVLSVTSETGTYTQFDVQEYGAVVLDNAIYTRNRQIEERFNITFKAQDDAYGKCYERLQQMFQANSAELDLVMLINRDAYSAAISGMLMPIERLTHLDLSKSYYLHDINEQCNIGEKQYIAYSEESLYTFQRSACLTYNKSIADSIEHYGDYYYDMVDEGTWTFEAMFEDAELATTTDESGNTDTWGLFGHYSYMFTAFFISAGERLVEKEGTELKFNAKGNERMDRVVTDVKDQISAGVMGYDTGWNEKANDYINTFNNGKALFNGTVVGKILLQKDIEGWDYGVLPYPMYEASQKQYYSWVVDAWLHVCPSTAPNPERTSVILEALASGSAKHVYPAYYEHALVGRSLRDEDSVRMLEIVRYNRIFDWGSVTWSQQLRVPIENDVFLGTDSLSYVCNTINTSFRQLKKQAEGTLTE